MPLPITAMSVASSGQSRGASGCPSNQRDEVGRAEGAGQLDAGDVELGVADGAGGEDDRVVVGAQVVQVEVNAVVHVADETDVARVEHLVQRVHDALDARVVGGDAVADQAVGGGQSIEQVDARLATGLSHGGGQDVAGVDAGRAGADDRDAEGGRGCDRVMGGPFGVCWMQVCWMQMCWMQVGCSGGAGSRGSPPRVRTLSDAAGAEAPARRRRVRSGRRSEFDQDADHEDHQDRGDHGRRSESSRPCCSSEPRPKPMVPPIAMISAAISERQEKAHPCLRPAR